ncbi:MAG: chromosome partitioning protein ParB [Parcubacteria group bacterium]|nr:chromosome partitioning protein ParB [Parcubacteria group bacterium]
MALGKGLNALIGSTKSTGKKLTKKATTKESRPGAGRDPSQVDQPAQEGSHMIPVSQINANPDQPRKQFGIDELQDLVQSIEKHGILQPLVVKEEEDGTYQIIAGERRFRASQMIGMTRVPCTVKPVDKKQELEISLVENIQRKNLNPLEEAYAYQRLTDEFGMTQAEVGSQVGKSRSYIANTIRLLDLPQDVQKGLNEGKISHTKARALLGLPTIRQQLKAFYDIAGDKQISTRATEQMVRKHRTKLGRRDPLLNALEERLREKLGTKVYMTNTKGRGSVKIDFFSDEEMNGVVQKILG